MRITVEYSPGRSARKSIEEQRRRQIATRVSKAIVRRPGKYSFLGPLTIGSNPLPFAVYKNIGMRSIELKADVQEVETAKRYLSELLFTVLAANTFPVETILNLEMLSDVLEVFRISGKKREQVYLQDGEIVTKAPKKKKKKKVEKLPAPEKTIELAQETSRFFRVTKKQKIGYAALATTAGLSILSGLAFVSFGLPSLGFGVPVIVIPLAFAIFLVTDRSVSASRDNFEGKGILTINEEYFGERDEKKIKQALVDMNLGRGIKVHYRVSYKLDVRDVSQVNAVLALLRKQNPTLDHISYEVRHVEKEPRVIFYIKKQIGQSSWLQTATYEYPELLVLRALQDLF